MEDKKCSCCLKEYVAGLKGHVMCYVISTVFGGKVARQTIDLYHEEICGQCMFDCFKVSLSATDIGSLEMPPRS